jgi:hypothetical protein
VVKLAEDRHAARVCEKAIAYADPINRSLLIEEILIDTEGGHPIPKMMRSDFASE